MIDLSPYTPTHQAELRALLGTPEWQDALASGLVDRTRRDRIEPGKTRPFTDTVVSALLGYNRRRAAERVAAGCHDEDALVAELCRWPANLGDRPPGLSFLGLNVTPACNLQPRCRYCNQPWVEPRLDLDLWKGIIAESTPEGEAEGPYIYLTGGEPLVLGEAIWGDGGLVRYATERGAGVNVNTNATLVSPVVALAFVRAGLLRLHISLDTGDPALHGRLRGGDGGLDAVLRGIYNVQLARALVGVDYPGIHTNCVLTNLNLDRFPELFAFLLERRERIADPHHPLLNDLFPHVIPVGGETNAHLRPTAAEFRRFYEDVWPRVADRWDAHQADIGIAEGERRELFGYFSNPFLRVTHRGGLDAYAEASAAGRYGELALIDRCHVAPTQAAFTPDGTQYRCGAHAIRHAHPLGHVSEGGVHANISRGLADLDALPDPASCDGCALATLYINQDVDKALRREVRELLSRT